jgi:hypothetical protein
LPVNSTKALAKHPARTVRQVSLYLLVVKSSAKTATTTAPLAKTMLIVVQLMQVRARTVLLAISSRANRVMLVQHA